LVGLARVPTLRLSYKVLSLSLSLSLSDSLSDSLPLSEIGGGGTLGKALALHLACVLPTCTGPMICLDDQYEDSFCEELPSKSLDTRQAACIV
jgi:hypothetical protein